MRVQQRGAYALARPRFDQQQLLHLLLLAIKPCGCPLTAEGSCELYALADDLQLQIPDVDAFIDSLNMAGEILKSGRLWKAAGFRLEPT